MKKVLALIVMAIAAMVILYVGMPVIAYGFWGLPVALAALTGVWIFFDMKVIPQFNGGVQTFIIKPNSKVPMVILVILALYSTVLPMVTSWPLLRTSDYRNLIGNIEVGENLTTHMAPISMEKIRVGLFLRLIIPQKVRLSIRIPPNRIWVLLLPVQEKLR